MTDKYKSTLAIATLLFLLILRIVAIPFPSARLWGINQLAFMPLPLAIALIIGIILVWLLFAYPDKTGLELIRKRLSKLAKSIPPSAAYIIVAVILVGLFYIFRDRVNLLGDSLLRIEELKKKGLARLFADTPGEILDYVVHWLTYVHILRPMGYGSLASFQCWSFLVGLVYVWTAWRIAIKLQRDNIERWLTMAWLLSWGGVMMFFGYAEEYTLAAVCQLLAFNFAIDYARGGKKLVSLLIVFLLGFFMHNLNVILLPAIGYLILSKKESSKPKNIIVLSIIAAIVISYLAWSRLGKEGGTFLLFDSKSEPGYTLLGKAHLLDILNQLLLINPGFLALIWLRKLRGEIKPGRRKLMAFSRVAALAGLLALFFIDPKLGMARDWDLLGLPLLAFHLAVFLSIDWQKIGRVGKIGAATISIGLTCIWIMLNSNQVWALDRYQRIAGLDSLRGGYNFEVLGDYYYERQQYAEAEKAFSQSVAHKPHLRCYVWLGHVQMWQKKYDLAEKNLKEALRFDPNESHALDYLSRLYYQTGRYEKSKEYLVRYASTADGIRNSEVPAALNHLDTLIARQSQLTK